MTHDTPPPSPGRPSTTRPAGRCGSACSAGPDAPVRPRTPRIDTVCQATGTGWVEADVDDHPELLPVFGELLPVVFVDGRRHDDWQVDPRRLAEALGSA